MLLLRSISNFITRDLDALNEKLTLTDADTRSLDKASLADRKEFLHRQTLETLTDLVCQDDSTETGLCWQSAEEEAYVRSEVAKLEFMLSAQGETNIKGSFIEKAGIIDQRETLVYDIYYKRILTDILLYRER